MNLEWARRELQAFRLAAQIQFGEDGVYYVATARPEEELVQQAYVVEKILDRLVPGWRTSERPDRNRRNDRWDEQREGCLRAISLIDRRAEIDENLGDDAPVLDAGHLHAWVWDGARSLWRTGHYGEAVIAAAIRVNAEAQSKLERRDISEGALLRSAFSTDPPKTNAVNLRNARVFARFSA